MVGNYLRWPVCVARCSLAHSAGRSFRCGTRRELWARRWGLGICLVGGGIASRDRREHKASERCWCAERRYEAPLCWCSARCRNLSHAEARSAQQGHLCLGCPSLRQKRGFVPENAAQRMAWRWVARGCFLVGVRTRSAGLLGLRLGGLWRGACAFWGLRQGGRTNESAAFAKETQVQWPQGKASRKGAKPLSRNDAVEAPQSPPSLAPQGIARPRTASL
jgi:hypothetical protein